MKKLISTLTAITMTAAMVTGCASNSAKSKNPEGVQKVPVAQIWDGYEDLQGKDLGLIKMPDKIEKQNVDGYYALELTATACDETTAPEKFFKTFFGDKYNEAMRSTQPETGYHIYNDPEVGLAVFTHAGEKNAAMPVSAQLIGKEMIDVTYETIGKYDPEKDRDVKLDLIGGSCTVGDIADTVSRFIKEGLDPLYDSNELTLKPYEIVYVKNKNDNSKKMAYVECAYDYKGIYLQSNISALADTTILAGHEVQVYYSFFHLAFELEGKDQITTFSARTLPFDPHAEELTELVPLSNAVELLKKELAVNSRYVFDKVELKYCQKSVQPNNYGINPEYDAEVADAIDKALNPIDKKLVPTWCFEWTGYDSNGAQDCAIKVNAVTGEITVDANPTADKPLDGSDPSSEETSSSEADASSSEADTTSSEPDESSKTEPPLHGDVPFDVISYDGQTLVYEYEGKTETYKFNEMHDDYLAYKIVNNKYGIKVKGLFWYDAVEDRYLLDTITPNGEYFAKGEYFGKDNERFDKLTEEQLKFIYSAVPDGVPMEVIEKYPNKFDGLAIAKRIKGSVYEVTSIYGKCQLDLNDRNYFAKYNYPDEIKGVSFKMFRFNSGEEIFNSLQILYEAGINEFGPWYGYSGRGIEDLPIFAGKIQSLTEDRAVVLLNDGKTTCDVPTYYNDGELKEGMDVMLTLEAEPSELYGSGQKYKAEYGVFTTHPEDIIEDYSEHEHSKIAYVVMDEEVADLFHYTMTDDIN